MERPLTPYEQWLQKEGIPVLTGYSVENVRTIQLSPWPRTSGKGVYVDLRGFEGVTGMYVCEIPPHGTLNPEKHLYEEIIYILNGEGKAEVWDENSGKAVCEWRTGSLFAVPLNCHHRMINNTSEPARFVAATTAPSVIDQFHNEEFIFNNPFCFSDRYSGNQDYFQETQRRRFTGVQWFWETNLVSDARDASVDSAEVKVSGGSLTIVELADNVFIAHLSDWPSGRYHKAHYHSAGAILLILKGKGYSLMWPRELGIHPFTSGQGDKVVRVDWSEGSVFCPPDSWFHQHFNTGDTAARQLALRYGSRKHLVMRDVVRKAGKMEGVMISHREGGTLIEYEDEDPEIRRIYEKELKNTETKMEMPLFRP